MRQTASGIYLPHALQFGAAASDVVNIPTTALLTDMMPFTWIVLVYPTTLTNGRRFMVKGRSATGGFQNFQISGTTGDINVGVKGSTNANFITNTTPIAVLNRWYWLAATFNSASSPQCHIYTGTVSQSGKTGLIEATFGTATALVTYAAQAASEDLHIGNSQDFTAAFQGRIGFAGAWNQELTQAQVEDTCNERYPIASSTSVLWMPLGVGDTARQLDRSPYGNHGASSGPLMRDGVMRLRPTRRRHSVEAPAAPPPGSDHPAMRRFGVSNPMFSRNSNVRVF